VSPPPWAAHFGLSRTPFGKSIPARDLFPRQAHAEAIARISFCIVESALGVVMGDVGAGRQWRCAPPSTASTRPATR
jgi:type II secretory pathway predicted ATPase ExeA